MSAVVASRPVLAAPPTMAAALAPLHDGVPQAWDAFTGLRAQARQTGDARLAVLAMAGLLIASHQVWRFSGFEACAAELAALPNAVEGLTPEEELLALNGLLTGLLEYHPRDPRLHAIAMRLHERVAEGHDVNLTLAAARTLLVHFDAHDLAEAKLQLHAVISPRTGEPGVTPFRVARWLALWWRGAYSVDQPRLGLEALEQLRAVAHQHHLHRFEFLAAVSAMDLAIPAGDLAAVRDALARAETAVNHRELSEVMSLEVVRSRVARLRGQVDAALRHALRASSLARQLELPPFMRVVFITNEAHARLHAEDYEGARTAFQGVVPTVSGAHAAQMAAMADGIDVFLAVSRRQADAVPRLAALWRSLREGREYNLFISFPAFSARLCVMALQHGIDADFVRSLVQRSHLAPPPDAPPNWPWALHIHALGGWVIRRDELPLVAEGKAQRRPLALLQAVVALGAFGEDHGVEVSRLAELLWSDEGAADPRGSFEAALSRLRRWLGVEGALKITDGKLSLNPRLVWCDVAAFERLCAQLEQAVAPHADMADSADLPRLLARLGALYRGPLLGHAALERWSVPARERLALRFARAVAAAGAYLETHRRWNEALDLYETALLQDMLAEPVHRALVRCHIALGQRAEAQRAFERCRSVLAAGLGEAPSPETCRLMADAGPR